jgi:hypothetical protein
MSEQEENTADIVAINNASHEQLRRALLKLAEKGFHWRRHPDRLVKAQGFGVRETIREAFEEVELGHE